MTKKSLKFNIFRILVLLAFIGASLVLVVEAMTPGAKSAQKSNDVAGGIAKIVNDMNGDQAKIIEPEQVKIKNKILNTSTGYKYQLQTETLPSNTKFKSYIYSSSDESIATITDDGTVSFLKQGKVTLTVANTRNPEVKDSFDVTIEDILVTDVEVSIGGVEPVSGVYTLQLGKTYYISANVLPTNATNKNVTYEVDENEYIKLLYRQINVLNDSNGEIIKIVVKSGDVEKILNVRTEEALVETYPVEGINVSPITGYVGSSVALLPKISFTPYNATDRRFEVVKIEDESIAKINSNNYISLLSPGETTITIKSLENEEITATARIIVSVRPEVTDYTARLSGGDVIVGQSKKISITNIKPSGAVASNITYSSEDESIATVSSSGNVTGVQVGVTNIHVTMNGIEKIVSVEVLTDQHEITDFDINYLSGENPYILIDEEINLRNYFTVNNFIPEEPINKLITYDVYDGNATITGNTLKAFDEGEITIIITHEDSGIYKLVNVTAIRNIIIDDSNLPAGNNLILDDVYTINFDTNGYFLPVIEISNYKLNYTLTQNQIIISPNSIGNVTLKIYPKYLGSKIDFNVKTYNFNISHLDTTTMEIGIKVINYYNEEKEISNEVDELTIYKNDKVDLSFKFDEKITRNEVRIKSSDSSVVKIYNNKLIPAEIGHSTITITETFSGLSQKLEITVINKLLLDEAKPVSISGVYEYDHSANKLTIVNGESVRVNYNFDKSSTVDTVVYKSSNEDILTIGKDGVITPNKPGEATITLEVIESDEVKISSEISVKIVKKSFVSNIESFRYYIRKGIGHFGAFLVTAILATMTAIFFFMYKKWWVGLIKIVAVLLYGFLFAGLTELIQSFVPGRAGLFSDVIIDFSGYSVGALIVTLIYLITIAIIIIINRRKRYVQTEMIAEANIEENSPKPDDSDSDNERIQEIKENISGEEKEE